VLSLVFAGLMGLAYVVFMRGGQVRRAAAAAMAPAGG
jgi:ethanolamine permease